MFKVAKKYLTHYQRSVFRGNISPSKLIELRNELKEVIDIKEDFICILKFFNENYFKEEIIGTIWKKDEDMFI